MAIIRLKDKYKSNYNVQLTPERHYISSSSGITGSVYVFPNRSEIQKDNIDERLDLAPGLFGQGRAIKPYGPNSLEQRRIDIFAGSLGKFIGGPFADASTYEYTMKTGNWPNGNTGTVAKTGQGVNALSFSTNDIIVREDSVEFKYTSNDNWVTGGTDIHVKVPTDDRDRSTLRYDVALGLLLDGANPYTEDHAWRQSDYSNPGNSSFTSASTPAQKAAYQFTGKKVFTDSAGLPYLDGPILAKSDINAWPPETLLPDVAGTIITNYTLQGYSDLSMHPRNKTKKEVIRKRANHDIFSSGSIFQKSIANRVNNLDAENPGWYVDNKNSLCLGSYSDSSGTKSPALAYHNTGDRYKINWATDNMTLEFWIKPCAEQTNVGTIVHLDNSYAVALLPDATSLKNGVYSKFKLAIYAQERTKKANHTPAISDVTTVSGVSGHNGGIYVTNGILNLDQWHHIALRYGANFNNGLMNLYVDSVSVTGGNFDGQHNGGTRTTGIFDVSGTSFTAGDTMFIGGWCPSAGATNLWGNYALEQEVNQNTSTSHADGLGVVPEFQLKSELMELRVWKSCRTEFDLLKDKSKTLLSEDVTVNKMKLYIPFLFDPRDDTPQWNRLGFKAKVDSPPDTLQKFYEEGEFLQIKSTNLSYNKTQYCTNSAFIVGMPFINVHSHLREYVQGSYPVITNFYILDDSTNTSAYPTVNDETPTSKKLIYFQNNWESLSWLRAINSMIIPCDNDAYTVDASVLGTGMHKEHVDGRRLKLISEISGAISSEFEMKHFHDDEIYAFQDTYNSWKEKQNDDGTSNTEYETTNAIFDEYSTSQLQDNNKFTDLDFICPLSTTIAVPQIYYGNRIHPESIQLQFELNEEGKNIVINDFGGTLYRCNPITGQRSVKVGHVDYGNGIICLFSPLLTSAGMTNFDLKFKGEKNMHVMQLDIPCSAGVGNKSQNPSYPNGTQYYSKNVDTHPNSSTYQQNQQRSLKASSNASESDGKVTYISTVYLHDENLNIIGKVNLAQPVVKREEDSYIFRVKVDF